MKAEFGVAVGTGSLVLLVVHLTSSFAAAEKRPPVRAPIPVARVFDRTIYAKDLEPSAEKSVAAMLALYERLGAPVPDDERVQLIASEKAAIAKMSRAEKRRYRKDTLSSMIWRPLMARYVEEHNLKPTDGEINDAQAAFRRLMEPEDELSEDFDDESLSREQIEALRKQSEELESAMAESSVQLWKFNKALHAEYGGRIIFQQSDPFEPIGAYRGWFEEHERLGDFAIYDAKMRKNFWKYYQDNDRDRWAVSDPDPFRTPWWLMQPDSEVE